MGQSVEDFRGPVLLRVPQDQLDRQGDGEVTPKCERQGCSIGLWVSKGKLAMHQCKRDFGVIPLCVVFSQDGVFLGIKLLG